MVQNIVIRYGKIIFKRFAHLFDRFKIKGVIEILVQKIRCNRNTDQGIFSIYVDIKGQLVKSVIVNDVSLKVKSSKIHGIAHLYYFNFWK